ncbi:MAG: hypothetical protein KAU21_20295, partial [Gammaproteobacteria bacterium]|nr:hypothetical protein [Gammaproteobacteria bacterium]
LEKIRNMIASLKDNLSILRQQPGDIDNPKKAINERRDIEDKILFYEDQESIENARVVKEQAEAKSQQRKDMLSDIAVKSEGAKNKHVELTKHVTDLVNQLVIALSEREQVFTNVDTGLNNPDLYELLTNDERDYLNKQLEYSVQGIYPGPFSATFMVAVNKHCADKSDKIKYGLLDLVKPSQDFHKPITGANSKLSNAAKQMSQVAAPEPAAEPVDIVKPKKTGSHYVADMRSPGPVVEI